VRWALIAILELVALVAPAMSDESREGRDIPEVVVTELRAKGVEFRYADQRGVGGASRAVVGLAVRPTQQSWSAKQHKRAAGRTPFSAGRTVIDELGVLLHTGPLPFTLTDSLDPSSVNRLTAFSGVAALELTFTDYGDREVAALLAAMPDLQVLGLGATAVTDRCLQDVVQLGELRVLELNDTALTRDGVEQLRNCRSLEELYIGGTAISEKGARALADLPRLRVLYVHRTNLSNEALNELVRSESIEELSIGETRIDVQGFANLKRLSRLRIFDVGGNRIGDDVVPHLIGCKRLEVLYLDATQVADDAAERLAEIANLKVLHLEDSGVSRRGRERIRELRPELIVLPWDVASDAQGVMPKAPFSQWLREAARGSGWREDAND
jgi:hypothetical protein